MLTLTRKPGESIKIGDDIRITVLVIYKKKIKGRLQASEDRVIYIRLGTTITVRDDITITLTNIDQGQVRLSIKAPKEVRIEREQNLGA